ncbi:LAME_0H17326g1_1 [Lachancea meyersii CBS 8951]|uniref:LAME_0H17326g1_1 n=1 Tax=Lachancea meyersii CBS 8951 TaxID=1266667 RepID=A0A1G4KIQ5_9SACH|nr:LAME_0H17326g1_1 [Lachancea meyersii CBS 8951]
MRFPICRFQSTLERSAMIQQKFKDSMARMGSQAMILTSASQKTLPHSNFRGVTLSSVSSLSLKPQPLLQFNLQLPSFTSESLHSHEYFAVHLLKPDATSMSLARTFSRGATTHKDSGEIIPTQPFKELAPTVHYDTYALKQNELVVPILTNSERVFVCQKKDVFRVGDHEIWIGKVEDIIENSTLGTITGGLIYCNRKFHKLGGHIE